MNKRTLAFAILFSFFLLSPHAASGADQAKVSKPFEYRGYSDREYKSYKRISEYVTMSDGVKLAVDAYIPANGPERKSFPVVMEYTPYSRAFINAAFKPLEKSNARNMMGGYGALIPMPFSFDMNIIEHGYVLVIADIRGSGASFGSRIDLSPQIGKDGKELIDWIAKQKWCDGKVGMKGGSYMAISQILTASERPKALKAIFLMVYPFGYHDLYIGGIYNYGFMSSFSDLLWNMNMNSSVKVGNFPIMPAAPVVDEDGDGELTDEIPLDLNKNGSFLDDYKYPENPNDPPQYADKSPRKHIYFLATKDHTKNIRIDAWVSKAPFIDTTYADLGIKSIAGAVNGYDISPISRIPQIMQSGIPIYHVGGWFDAQPKSTTIFYATAAKTNPSKLLMVPVYHIMTSPYIKYFGGRDDDMMSGVKVETLRYFDHYLKGIDNGIDREPPVTLYVMGKGMRQENEWPLKRQQMTPFFFSEGNSLSAAAGNPGEDVFKADLSQDSSFGPVHGNRWKMYVIMDKVPDRAELDKKCQVYTSQPLDHDTEVTGHPMIDMWVSSTARDGDFFVYLSDVTEDGTVVLVTEQPLRAGFAGLRNEDMMILRGKTGTHVLPDLPWHGFEKADYNENIFSGGGIVELKFDLQPTSWVFKKGHRIRVSVAAADWPTFPLNPALSPKNNPADPGNTIPVVTFHRDPEHPSRILLPVIPDSD